MGVDLCNIIMMASREELIPPIASPLRRKRLHTQDNIRISSHLSAATLRRPRINTLNNEEEERPSRQPSLRKATSSKLVLSPVKFYETRLAVSCQAWSAYSIPEGSYKRGWKPNRVAEFNGLVRLAVAGAWLGLLEKRPVVGSVTVRANRCILAQEQRQSVRDLQRLRSQDGILAENTIMPLRDLVAAMLITNSNELLLYSAVFVGYMLKHGHNVDLGKAIIIGSFTQGAACTQALIEEVNLQIGQRFPNTRVASGLQFTSTSHQLSQYFAELVKSYKILLPLLQAKEVVSAIRFQVGFKFYEERTKRFPSQRVHSQGHVVVSCRGRTNFGVISFNKGNSMVLVLHDCKYGMAQVDINRIEEWFRSTSKLETKIEGKEQKQSRLLPLLKLLQ